MGFFKKMFTSIGIGSARVDTVLEQDTLRPGETIDAVVEIKGGTTQQEITGLYFTINASYEGTMRVRQENEEGEVAYSEEDVTRTAVIDKLKLAESFVIGPGEEKEIPASLTLPLTTPVSVGKTSVWVHTGLDIPRALDPGDRDNIKVLPEKRVRALFSALEELGFKMVEVECEVAPEGFRYGLSFVQEFEFKPVGGPFRGRLDELEIVCFPDENRVEVLMEIDRKVRGFGSFVAEMMEMDESRIKFSYTAEDIDDLRDKLAEYIGDNI